jgi:Ran GTPase-activating protein (RanGAP) involved in mRNA processing and transport
MRAALVRPVSAFILRLDSDALDAILQRCELQDIGRLSASCSELNAGCAQLLARLTALTEAPFYLPPCDIWGAASCVAVVRADVCIGDAGVAILAHAFSSGALACCEHLYLNHNDIGDTGLRALAIACERGALPRLERLSLMGNRIGDAGFGALVRACTKNAVLPRLWDLWLSGNAIGPAGMAALAWACAKGALGMLCTLTLSHNVIGHAGATTLADALRHGALPRLAELGVDEAHAEEVCPISARASTGCPAAAHATHALVCPKC